jgi:hypothetical protein
MSVISSKDEERKVIEICTELDRVIGLALGLIGNGVSEEEVISDFLRLAPDEYSALITRFFEIWSRQSDTLNAKLYRMGKMQAAEEIKWGNVRRASNGRRLIGATSRAKVQKAAQAFRHLSRSNASYEMAELVNLDAGTIKRYLTELFPGDKWKQ